MEIQKNEAFEAHFKSTQIYCREFAIRGKDILEFSKTMGGYFNIVANDAWNMWQTARAKAVPEGFVLIKDNTKTVVAIERMVEQQVEASGMDSRRLERLDGWRIIEAAVKAQEQTHE